MNNEPMENNVVNESEQTPPQRARLVCPKCGSVDIHSQIFQEQTGSVSHSKTKTKVKVDKGHGCLWWLFFGWWWKMFDFIFWLCFFPIRFIIHLMSGHKANAISKTREKTKNKIEYRTVCMCNSCGYHWEQ